LRDPQFTILPIADLVARVQKEKKFVPTKQEIDVFISELRDADKIMVGDHDVIYPV
jgi:hypothetical protein